MLGQTIFSQAARTVCQEHITQYSLAFREDDLLDISVCFDDSRLTRGHKSHVIIGSVIDVPDAHPLSLYSAVCAKTGAWIKRETLQRYDRWKADHVARGECTINFEGTSGMMEVEAGVVEKISGKTPATLCNYAQEEPMAQAKLSQLLPAADPD
ncbi:hypothetical protein PoB_000448700 [Plakobranchus ocellatus]|uniref:Uncharacterized protein n=1 Tax=Plakobranchus ocellatus TaxID=259542 RepID=A0AAV3Y699_9GAST|nr:hypothetical protein PoB_000448700 [Plakobranchus ocellatus]